MRGKSAAAVVMVLLFIPGLSRSVSRADFGFILGVSQGSPEAIPVMKELGIHWGRMSITWKEVMPVIEEPFPSLDEVMDNPAMVDALIEKTDWSAIDKDVRLRLDNGIQPIPIVGSGWHNSYASFEGKLANPDLIGEDHYLAFMYLYTRAVVERYDGDGHLDAPGIMIKLWQTENELNQAGLTAGWGWREPQWIAGLASPWGDWKFVTKVMSVIHAAVHDADPGAMNCMNFHTDVPPSLNRLFHQPDWPEAVRQWKDLMDVIAFDAYPNYYAPDPVRGVAVGERVKTIRGIVGDKPIVLMEGDYPHGPSVRGYTPEKQAEFLRSSYDAARAAGIDGYFKFCVVDPNGPFQVEITDKDLKNLERVVPWWEKGKVMPMLFWALPRAGYVKNHFLDVVKSVEGNWGVIDQQGNKLPAYYVLQDIVRENEAGK